MHSKIGVAVVALALAALPASAQTSPPYEWGFTNTVSTSLPQCGTLALSVDTLTAAGVPPFYMMAFPVGGAPITSFIGRNGSALEWTVPFAAGTQLLLTVVDAHGTSGGVDIPLYTVVAGSNASTRCIPPPTTDPPFTITSTIANGSTLQTCASWVLEMAGGKPPYTVTLAALNSPVITNATLGPTDTFFSYPNRAEPNTEMIAAVSDSTGRWATGSPVVFTAGSNDTTCPGKESQGSTTAPVDTSGSSSPALASQTAAPPASGGSSSHVRTIAIAVGASVGALVLLAGLLVCMRMHRHAAARRKLDAVEPSAVVSPFQIDVSALGPGVVITGVSPSPSPATTPVSFAMPLPQQAPPTGRASKFREAGAGRIPHLPSTYSYTTTSTSASSSSPTTVIVTPAVDMNGQMQQAPPPYAYPWPYTSEDHVRQ